MATGILKILDITGAAFEAHLDALTDILHACVHDGASVNFILPFEAADARRFWTTKVAAPLHAGHRILLAARLDDAIAGTVQLDLETPPNQAHRAEVMKLLVHPRYRRQGIARGLMLEIERRAQACGRRLLTLDTASTDKAEPLYAALGYLLAGRIPDYCRASHEDRLEATSIMYKPLTPAA